MDSIIERIKSINPQVLNYESLFDLILPFDPDQINFQDALPKIIDQKEYSRSVLLLDPLEVVLIQWPAGAESAIHLHDGFWGYVGVLQGVAYNVEYLLENNVLKQKRAVTIQTSGVIPEPDGVIHKIMNASSEAPLVTLHFYYPALKDLDNLQLFGVNGTMVKLNEKAKSASLSLSKDCYKSYLENQFHFEDGLSGKKHIINPILPKPSNDVIKEMIYAYYSEQVHDYDNSDLDDDKRRLYVERVNAILAEDFIELKPGKVFSIASGTGRRAARIKELSGLDYELFGVDLNDKMCDIARTRGITTFCSDWMDVDIPDKQLDVITMLYAFGHVPDARERLKFLEKIHQKLKHGGVFYFDVFNINDPFEWGEKALAIFNEYRLDYFAYEKGDVFYKRKGMNEVAFLHYFEEERLIALLESIGFEVSQVFHIGYVHKSGQIVGGNEGKLLLKAVKV